MAQRKARPTMRQRAALKGWATRRAKLRARMYDPTLSEAERIRLFWRSVEVHPSQPDAKWWRFVKRVNSR